MSRYIDDLVSDETFIEIIFSAAKEVYHNSREIGLKKNEAMECITPTNIASKLSKDTTLRLRNKISNAIYEHYRSEMIHSKAIGQKVISTQLLRRDVFKEVENKNMEFNSQNGRKNWEDKPDFSKGDISRGIKIPKTLDYIASFVLTSMLSKDDGRKDRKAIQFKYSPQKHEYYEQVLFPLYYEMFNVGEKIDSIRNPFTYRSNTKREKTIVSPFLLTFLAYVSNERGDMIDFEKIKDIKNIPHKKIGEMKESAFYSAINRDGIIKIIGNRKPFITISRRKNMQYLQDLQKLGVELGYQTFIHEKSGVLYLPADTIEKLAESSFFRDRNFPNKTRGAFVNPYMIQRLDEYQKNLTM